MFLFLFTQKIGCWNYKYTKHDSLPNRAYPVYFISQYQTQGNPYQIVADCIYSHPLCIINYFLFHFI